MCEERERLLKVRDKWEEALSEALAQHSAKIGIVETETYVQIRDAVERAAVGLHEARVALAHHENLHDCAGK